MQNLGLRMSPISNAFSSQENTSKKHELSRPLTASLAEVHDIIPFCGLPACLHVAQCVEVYTTRSSFCKVPFEKLFGLFYLYRIGYELNFPLQRIEPWPAMFTQLITSGILLPFL